MKASKVSDKYKMMMAGIISKINKNKEEIKDKKEEEIIEIASIIKRISKEINIRLNNRKINRLMMINMMTRMIITNKNSLRKSNTKRKCILIVIEAREGEEEEIKMKKMLIKTMEIMIKAKRLTEKEDKEGEIKEEIEEEKVLEIDKSMIKTNSTKKNIMILINKTHKVKIKMGTSKEK